MIACLFELLLAVRRESSLSAAFEGWKTQRGTASREQRCSSKAARLMGGSTKKLWEERGAKSEPTNERRKTHDFLSKSDPARHYARI